MDFEFIPVHHLLDYAPTQQPKFDADHALVHRQKKQ